MTTAVVAAAIGTKAEEAPGIETMKGPPGRRGTKAHEALGTARTGGRGMKARQALGMGSPDDERGMGAPAAFDLKRRRTRRQVGRWPCESRRGVGMVVVML